MNCLVVSRKLRSLLNRGVSQITKSMSLKSGEVLAGRGNEMGTDLWVFGYGSLIWKVDFKIEKQCLGFIKGYKRRFYQNSLDHRGTPEKPGRVVTLIPADENDDEAKVFGMGYKIPAKDADEVLKHLDYREKNGYSREIVKFYPYPYTDGIKPIDILLYIGTKDNPSYVGHINDLNVIAKQIFSSRGPSGDNREYVYHLAESMRKLYPNERDEHLFDLESILRKMESQAEV